MWEMGELEGRNRWWGWYGAGGMVSLYAIHDGSGWTPRLVLRQPAQPAEVVREECVPTASETDKAWAMAILQALDVFPEAQEVVRRRLLVLCGYPEFAEDST